MATHSLVLVTTAAGRGYVIEKAAMPDELVQEDRALYQNQGLGFRVQGLGTGGPGLLLESRRRYKDNIKHNMLQNKIL